MSDINQQAQPVLKVWLKSAHLIGAAGLLAAVLVMLSLLFIQFERSDKTAESLSQHQQLAKLMAHQTAADLTAVESMLLVLASSDRNLLDERLPGRMEALVTSVVRSHPQLRSVSVLNEAGRVLGSTSPANLNSRLDMTLFGALPLNASRVVIGTILSGRDLADLQHRTPAASGLNVLPMLVRLSTPAGQGMLLVALINADYFASLYESSANDPTVRVALIAYQGELLVASSNVRRTLGSDLRLLPMFADYLPKRERGSYIGAGLDNDHVSSGFFTLPRWPMVLLVESSYSDVMQDVDQLEKWILWAVLASLLVIAALTTITTLSLRRHAHITRKLHGDVYASEARNKAVLDSAIDAVVTVDSAGLIIAFNRAAEHIFGYDRADCIGKSIEQLLVPRHLRSSHKVAMERYFQTGDGPVLARLNHRIETYAMRSDDTVFPVEMSNVAVQVGDATFFTTTVRDITKEKAAAAELEVTLRHYRELAAALELQKQGFDHHAIVSISDANEVIVYANDKLVDILGYSQAELIGRKYYEFRQELPQEMYDSLRSSLAEGHVWHGEMAMCRRDGSKYWVSNTTVPIFDEHGAIKQYITVQTDISDLRQTEIDLIEARKSEHQALIREREADSLKRAALERERTAEINVGKNVQKSLLAVNALHDLAGLWLTSFNQASQGVDGDFVDVIRMGEHCVDILAGDVMGKGVPAALMGAATKLQFSRSIAELLAAAARSGEAPAPSCIVASVHQAMTPRLQDLDAFVTLVYLRVDTLRNVLTWIGCGHEETVLIRADGGLQLLSNQHPPLGVLDQLEFQQEELPLKVGDAVFLCSDGLTDAIQADGERVGRDLLNQTLRKVIAEHKGPAAALHSLRQLLLPEGVRLTDDVTMVLLLRKPVHDSETRCELPINLDSLRPLRAFVEAQTQRALMSEQEVALLTVASVEVFTNVVRHARGLLADAPVELIARCQPGEFVLEVIHLGEAFTPPEVLGDTNFDDFPEGGFGLTIIRNACDKLEYLHCAGVNTVRMTRYIES